MSAKKKILNKTNKTIWEYNPIALVLPKLLLSIFLGFVAWYYYNTLKEVTLALGIISFVNLIPLIKYCKIKIEIDGNNLMYSYKSLFKKRIVLISPEEVKDIQPKDVKIWTQERLNKLFLVLENEFLEITPFYAGQTTKVRTLKEKISEMVIKKQKIKKIEKQHQSQKKKQKKKNSKNSGNRRRTKVIWAMIEMNISCPRCDSPVLIKGPFTQFTCKGCGEQIDLTPEIWADLLEDTGKDLAKMAEGEGSNSTIWGTFNVYITYGRLKPYCKKCKRDYDVKTDYKEESNEIVCSDCNSIRPAQKPPEWFNGVIKNTKLFIGAAPDLEEEQPSKRKLFMTCPACGGPVEVFGKSRNEKCIHCDSTVLLPDDVWEHLHPVQTKARWFVKFLT